jgi:hypothetical protein
MTEPTKPCPFCVHALGTGVWNTRPVEDALRARDAYIAAAAAHVGPVGGA